MHGGVHPREVGAPYWPRVARDGIYSTTAQFKWSQALYIIVTGPSTAECIYVGGVGQGGVTYVRALRT